MTSTAIERKNRSGCEPERLDTAIERNNNMPETMKEINHPCHCSTPCQVCACREASNVMRNGGGR